MLSGTATVDLSGFQRLRTDTRQAAFGLCQRAARDGARRGYEVAKERAPVGTYYNLDGSTRRGGRLKRELQVQFDQAIPFGAQWEFVAPTPYARFVEYDTPPHRITATNAPQLIFYWPVIGGVFEGGSVNHPGTRAQPFMAPGGDAAHETIVSALERGFVGIAARWN